MHIWIQHQLSWCVVSYSCGVRAAFIPPAAAVRWSASTMARALIPWGFFRKPLYAHQVSLWENPPHPGVEYSENPARLHTKLMFAHIRLFRVSDGVSDSRSIYLSSYSLCTSGNEQNNLLDSEVTWCSTARPSSSSRLHSNHFHGVFCWYSIRGSFSCKTLTLPYVTKVICWEHSLDLKPHVSSLLLSFLGRENVSTQINKEPQACPDCGLHI